VLVNIARYLSLDPESALRKTNRKFKRRFQWMEERLRRMGGAAAGFHGRTGNTMATGETAGKTGMIAAALTIRKCEALEEMQACFRLQKEVWEFSDAELIPVRLFVVASKIGGR